MYSCDPEFTFEISSGLLGKRDKVIQDMKEEMGDLEKTVEFLCTALWAQE